MAKISAHILHCKQAGKLVGVNMRDFWQLDPLIAAPEKDQAWRQKGMIAAGGMTRVGPPGMERQFVDGELFMDTASIEQTKRLRQFVKKDSVDRPLDPQFTSVKASPIPGKNDD